MNLKIIIQNEICQKKVHAIQFDLCNSLSGITYTESSVAAQGWKWGPEGDITKGRQDFPGGTVDKNAPANAGDTGSISGPGRLHMLQSSQACVPQLLCLHCRTLKLQLLKPLGPRAHTLQLLKAMHSRARGLQQEKRLQWKAHALQPRAAPAHHN